MPHDNKKKPVKNPAIFIQGFFFVSLASIICFGQLRGQSPKVFTGNEDQAVSLTDVQKMVDAFQEKAPSSAVKGEYFGKKGILNLLDHSSCVGMRVYYGRKTDGMQVLILVGVDSVGNDLPAGPMIQNGFPCPPFCDTTNTINH